MTILEDLFSLEDVVTDERVKSFWITSSPLVPGTTIVLYLLSVYVIFPQFMRNRKAYKLKRFLFWYNLFQIWACCYLIYGIATSGWTTYFSWGCQPVDCSDNPLALRMVNFLYYCVILRFIELIETVVFILRKKDRQVSRLHVYHHASTVAVGWMGLKFIPGGMASFPALINCSIHVIMYTYYLVSSLGPEWQKTALRWKSKVTVLQMIQFGVMICHALQALHPSCKVQKVFLLMYVPNILLIWALFWNFYKIAYLKKSKKA